MSSAPLVSTFVALALIPVAFLFTHAYITGRKHHSLHRVTGPIAIVWDLSLSIFYMLFRTFGGQVEGTGLKVEGAMLAYFVAHGMIAVVVIALELVVLVTGAMQLRKKAPVRLHGRIVLPLYFIWWAAFLSGEVVYLVNYVL